MLLVTFLAKSFHFGSVEIQMYYYAIHYSRNPCFSKGRIAKGKDRSKKYLPPTRTHLQKNDLYYCITIFVPTYKKVHMLLISKLLYNIIRIWSLTSVIIIKFIISVPVKYHIREKLYMFKRRTNIQIELFTYKPVATCVIVTFSKPSHLLTPSTWTWLAWINFWLPKLYERK